MDMNTSYENKWKRKTDLGIKILENCRNELYRFFPYLDGAFASLEIRAAEREDTDKNPENESMNMEKNKVQSGISTDGELLYFNPDFLLKQYMENPSGIKRGYLHILLHCLYLHLFPANAEMDRRLWNLACDISVEQMIEQEIMKNQISILDITETKVAGFSEKDMKNMPDILKKKPLPAEKIYHMLREQYFPYSLREMEAAFVFDDHDKWESWCKGENAARLRKKWERIASYTVQSKQDGQNRRGSQVGDAQEMFDNLKPGRYDYRRFLKKFAIPREEVELDTESFDYIFYHYGLEHYENLPLIEPLEYKEVNRLEELVIAIDTSGSCSKEMVQQFLDETYRIFSEKENFFRKMKVHILQCDCHLQDVVVIHSEEEWREYSKNIVIQGRSGTNFRPVFRYVEEQRKKKEIKNLRALIYFTDGDGVFPEKTDYETAFVFVKKCECMDLIPSWITKLLIYQ